MYDNIIIVGEIIINMDKFTCLKYDSTREEFVVVMKKGFHIRMDRTEFNLFVRKLEDLQSKGDRADNNSDRAENNSDCAEH